MQLIHWFSIILEVAVALVGLNLALYRKKSFGWGIALTFAIYVFYDITKFLSLDISSDILYVSFFIASVSALWFTWQLNQTGKKK